MSMPGFSAKRSLDHGCVLPAHVEAAPAPKVVAQMRWRGGGRRISMEQCWQACINGIGECPPECAAVPWPTIPPPAPRYLRA